MSGSPSTCPPLNHDTPMDNNTSIDYLFIPIDKPLFVNFFCFCIYASTPILKQEFKDSENVCNKQRYKQIWLFSSENLYSREFTSGNLRENRSQGYCVLTDLDTSLALLSQLENWRQLCVCFDSKILNLAGEPDVYSQLLQFFWFLI